MSSRPLFLLFLVFAALASKGQVPVTTGSYFQDFGSTDVTSWVNNNTYPGWYQSQTAVAGHVNVSGTAPGNAGGFYTYECNGANDQKIGSRGSGSATLVRYGVVLRNQTGVSIISLRVSYRGFQMSLAQNGNVTNRTTFDYVVSSSIPGISALATAAVPALNFTQLQNSSVAGANQISGYPCTQSTLVSGCIALATPLANGSYILLRWNDVDDPNNDHHMAIDDVHVDFDLTGTGCSVLLPVELVSFDALPVHGQVRLNWTTATEHDNDYFVVERSADGLLFEPVARVPGTGNSAHALYYTALDPWPLKGLSYYRLRQVDYDGAATWSQIVSVMSDRFDQSLSVVPAVSEDGRFMVIAPEELVGALFSVVDGSGAVVLTGRVPATSFPLDLGSSGSGLYMLSASSGATTATVRIITVAR